jgi:hypothetical protein
MMDDAGSVDEAGGAGARQARPTWASPYGHFAVTVVAERGWRVSDLRVPEEDASHVVAFIELRDEKLEVVWLRGSIAVPELFDSLDSALDVIDGVLTSVRFASAQACV